MKINFGKLINFFVEVKGIVGAGTTSYHVFPFSVWNRSVTHCEKTHNETIGYKNIARTKSE